MSTNVGTGGEVVDIDLLTTIKAFAITKAENNNLEGARIRNKSFASIMMSFEIFCLSNTLIEMSVKVETILPCFVRFQ